MSPTRRQLLKWGVGAGALAGAGVVGARAVLLPPAPSREPGHVGDLAVRFVEALDSEERADALVDYEHPMRQYHNRGVDTGGAWVIGLGREARGILVDLVHAGLSERGRARIPNQFFLSWPGVHATRVVVCGDPRTPPYQILVTGPHLNLRLGGRSREGVAFGGPQVYGDQRGNGEVGLPGNVYRYQLEAGQRLVASLTQGERRTVRRPKAPPQTAIEVQGRAGRFDGLAVADLAVESRRLARALVGGILESYAEEDAAYAWECIEHNGGVDALHLADYDVDHQGGRRAGEGPSQIIRLEGPAAVFHYRGEPHLHAFLNVAMDGERPLSVGEVVAHNPEPLGPEGVKALFEEVMLASSDADLAYYPLESVAGRLRAGEIRTGDLYNLESWREQVVVVSVKGADLAEPQLEALRRRGDAVRSGSTYRIATFGYAAEHLADEALGDVGSEEETGSMLRELAIVHLADHGFPSVGG